MVVTAKTLIGALTLVAGQWTIFAGSVETTRPAHPCAEEIAAKLEQSDNQRRDMLAEYSVVRKYTLRNTRMGSGAAMTVQWQFRKGEGKSYQVLTSNAEGTSARVMKRVLDGEAEAAKKEVQARVTAENYDFRFLSMETRAGRLCYLVELSPKKKSKYLLEGKAWVDAEDFAIVRIEGRPTANISFWVGKPYFEIEFQKVGEFWLTSSNHSIAETRLLGSSDLRIECVNYKVQGGGALAGVRSRPRLPGSASN